jgi:hypothetical protein
VAYYFHLTVRCDTCLRIENLADQFIKSRCGAELASEALVFKPVDYEKPENAHFAKHYELPCPSLVLVRQVDGQDQQWKLLGKTWDLVEIPPRLRHYLEEELSAFLEPSTVPPP